MGLLENFGQFFHRIGLVIWKSWSLLRCILKLVENFATNWIVKLKKLVIIWDRICNRSLNWLKNIYNDRIEVIVNKICDKFFFVHIGHITVTYMTIFCNASAFKEIKPFIYRIFSQHNMLHNQKDYKICLFN